MNFESQFEFIETAKGLLGHGSHSQVKLARNRLTGQLVAVKIIDKLIKNSPRDNELMNKEIYFHKQLNHPNIIKLLTVSDSFRYLYIVLEFAPNGTIFDLLFKRKRLAESEARNYFIGTCQAIHYLHSMNLMHRDFKSENLLLDQHNNIKLCDFGHSENRIHEPKKTFCGTYEYMSPEMASKQTYNQRIDIWGLGIFLYEILHGNTPFKGQNTQETKTNILHNQVLINKNNLSPSVCDLITIILRKNPLERPSALQILQHPWCNQFQLFHNPLIQSEQFKCQIPIPYLKSKTLSPIIQRQDNFINKPKDRQSTTRHIKKLSFKNIKEFNDYFNQTDNHLNKTHQYSQINTIHNTQVIPIYQQQQQQIQIKPQNFNATLYSHNYIEQNPKKILSLSITNFSNQNNNNKQIFTSSTNSLSNSMILTSPSNPPVSKSTQQIIIQPIPNTTTQQINKFQNIISLQPQYNSSFQNLYSLLNSNNIQQIHTEVKCQSNLIIPNLLPITKFNNNNSQSNNIIKWQRHNTTTPLKQSSISTEILSQQSSLNSQSLLEFKDVLEKSIYF